MACPAQPVMADWVSRLVVLLLLLSQSTTSLRKRDKDDPVLQTRYSNHQMAPTDRWF